MGLGVATKGILFTGDWQGSWANISRLEKFLDWLALQAVACKAKQVVILGDLKEALNPVDVRVTNTLITSISKLHDATGERPIILLGNHDRIGMQDDSGDWLQIFAAAGAETISEPKTIVRGDWRFHGVPYYGNNETSKQAFKMMARHDTPDESLLLFHTTLSGTQFSYQRKATSIIRPADLLPDKYAWCLGGHIHLRQSLGRNVQYVGSPFSQDWGEANQPKGIVHLSPNLKTLSFLESPLQQYCDPNVPNFKEPSGGWANAIIRLRASEAKEERVLEKGRRLYPGATFIVRRPAAADVILADAAARVEGSDRELVTAYIKEKVVTSEPGKLIEYLIAKLAKVPGAIGSNGFELLSIKARNVLSFQKIEVDYTKEGLYVVSGKNEDRGGSNASGKSNYLNLPLVGLFGRTLKRQENDEWVCQYAKGKHSVIRTTIRLADGRIAIITRRRKPKPELRLTVDGENISSGFGKHDTQKRIEQILGITWDSLVNAMYIDQRELNLLLVGTETERRSLFAHLFGLNRFQLAAQLVTKELTKVTMALKIVPVELEAEETVYEKATERLKELKESLRKECQETEPIESQIKALNKRARYFLRKALTRKQKASRAKDLLEDLTQQYHQLRGSYLEMQKQVDRLTTQGACPMCGSRVALPVVNKAVAEAEAKHKKLGVANRSKVEAMAAYEKRLASWRLVQIRGDKAAAASNKLQRELDVLLATNETRARLQSLEARAKKEMQDSLVSQRILNAYKKDLLEDREFLQVAEKVLGRRGLPEYLLATMCPVLNQATELYSDLFADGDISVSFTTELAVQIRNTSGGRLRKDLSEGETRIASLITSFAARQVLSRFNVLIADEPGGGLDAHNSGPFAKALGQLAGQFGRVLLTTHNPYILQALDGAEQITVVKRNKVSQVEKR